MSARRGFTLLELLVVLVLLSITAAAAVPALLGARMVTPTQRAVEDVRALLLETRDAARERGTHATLVLAPADARYWMTRGDSVVTGTITLGPGVRFGDASGARITCRFGAAAPANPCVIVVRGETTDTLAVDAWSGDVATRSAR